MGSILQKLIRGCVILAIGLAVVWFGFYIRPFSGEADAKVFEKLFSYTQAMPDYWLSKGGKKPRKIKVNGNQTYLTVQSSKDDIAQILDFYAGQYPPLSLFSEVVEQFSQIDQPSIVENISKIYDTLECVKGDQQFRYQRDNYGVWGAFEFFDQQLKIGSCQFNELVAEALKSGALGRIGTFRVALVLKQGDGGGSKIINIWTDEEFNLHNLYPDANGDMPGKDIDKVPRYPGAVRCLSVEQENIDTIDSVVIYESEGSELHHILYYHTAMKNAGWNCDPLFDKTMRAAQRNQVMFYTLEGRQCTITVQEENRSGKILTTITERKSRKA